MERADLVVIGRVVKPHGIRGEIAVDALTDVPGRFDAGVSLYVGDAWWVVVDSRRHQGRVLVTLEGVPDRTAAEALRGAEVLAEALDPDELDTYLVSELVGMAVVDDATDVELGEVVAVIELPPAAGYDLLEVARPDGSTFLLPDVEEYVEVVADGDGTRYLRVVDPPEGLIDGAGHG